MVNWDSYGWMTHNYYLYADPSDDGRFVWLPWDLNEAMLEPPGGGPGPGGVVGADSVLLDEIGGSWPMIRDLLDDPVYEQQYRAELEAALTGAFEADALKEKMRRYSDLIAPYVVGAGGEVAPYTNLTSASAFEGSVTGNGGLEDHVDERHEAVQDALGL
jgi:spore coat protein CotH